MSRLRNITALATILALAQLAAPSPGVGQESAASTMIVFDGSGSMWGKLGATSVVKFQGAREALREALPKMSPDTRVGLASFGHRRTGDCTDVEIILPDEPVSVDRLLPPLEKLNPKGRGPLVQALRDVAKGLAGKSAASIILIHDDPDNCQQDACAAIKDVNAASPKLTVHVISLGMRKEDLPRMACVAKSTGGRHFDVQDGDDLKSAIGEALTLVSAAAGSGAGAAPRARGQPAAEQKQGGPPKETVKIEPPAETAPVGLYPTATLTATSQPIDVPTRWRLFRDITTTGTLPIAEVIGINPHIDVAAGTYMLEAHNGLVTRQTKVEVRAAGPTRITVALDAASIRLAAPLRKGEADAEGLSVTLSENSASGRTLWVGPPSTVVVPAGTYRAAAGDGRTRRERVVTVAAGANSEADLSLQAGLLKLRATDRDNGSALDPVLFVLTEDAPDLASGRREVARSTAPTFEALLPAGTYYIMARYGAVEARDNVAIAPGDTMTRTLVVPIGHVAISARMQNGSAPPTDQIFHRITLLDGQQPREVARASGLQADFQLPAGRYRIESQLGGQNAILSRELDVRAGARERVTVEHAAGAVRLKLIDKSGKPLAGDLSWEIRDSRDQPVWRTIQQEPRAILAAGSYKVRIEARSKRLESTFEVRIGEQRSIEIVTD